MPTGKLGTAQSFLGSVQLGVDSGSLEQTLTHTMGLSAHIGHVGLAAHTINWSHTAFFELIIGDQQNVVHSLGIGHQVDAGTFPDVVQNLGIGHTVLVVNFGPILQNLNMVHAVTFAGPIVVSPSNTITMTHIAGIAKDQAISHNLNLTHVAADVQQQDLNLTHSVMAYLNASPHFEHDLEITHTVQISLAYIANLAHTSVVVHAITYFIDDGTGCPRNDFQQHGTLGEEPFTAQTGAKLVFTNITGTDDIVLLRNPELDDRDRVGYTRVNRESEGGELQVFRDPTWPLVNTVQGTVVGLKKQDVNDWLDFLEEHLGEEISMADWHGRYWRGVIINVNEPVVEDTRDRWTMAFEFEGVEMPGPDVIQQVGIAHALQVIQELTRDMSHNLGIGHTVVVETNQVLHNGDFVFYRGDKVIYSGPP